MVAKKTGKPQKKNPVERAIRWVGSVQSLYVHTAFFLGMFLLGLFHVPFEHILLILTTAVSLEAIYLAIFIQLSVNEQAQDIDEIQEDVDEIQKDVDEIQKDVDEIQDDVEDIQEIEVAERKDKTLDTIESDLKKLLGDIQLLRNEHKQDQ